MAEQDVLHVLIVDDDEHDAAKYGSAVEKRCEGLHQEVQVLTASTASGSLTRMENLKDKRRVFVFCDNELGKHWKVEDEQCTGLDMLPHIRKALPQSRTVLYSARASKPDIRIALERGAYDMVTRRSFEAASKGLLTVLAQMAAIEQRMAEAKAAEEGDIEDTDPLAHLLMKIRTSLMMVGRHGRIWFQNKHNQAFNQSIVDGGELCYGLFHGWKCAEHTCPWCPTIESMQSGKSVERTLLLPLRREGKKDLFRIGCVRMLSEPLWPLGGGPKQDTPCAGAIECSFGHTKEWETKPPIEKTLDLLVTLVGLLQRTVGSTIQINFYEIGVNQQTCRPVVACVVEMSGNREDAPLGTNSRFLVQKNAAFDEDLAGFRLGPAAACPKPELTDAFPAASFHLSKHAARDSDTDAGTTIRGDFSIGDSKFSLPWQSESCDAESVKWHYLVISDESEEKAKKTALLEIGCCTELDCLNHCLTEQEGGACDLDLFLHHLSMVAKEVRVSRMERRDKGVPAIPLFDACNSLKSLWSDVEEAMKQLRSAVELTGAELWCHFREYTVEEDPFGESQHVLRLVKDAATAVPSPYARHAINEDSCRNVEVAAPETWSDDVGEELAFGNCFVLSPTNESGSRSCRVSGRPRLCHEAPPKIGDTNLGKVIRLAEKEGDAEAVRLLNAVQSFGDFPVGKKVDPVGTFHIQSTVDDVFSPTVFKFLIGVAAGIERALLRIRAQEKARELDRLELKQERERLIRDHLAGRTARIAEMLGVDPNSLDRDLLRSLARGVSFHQRLLDDHLAAESTNLENRADFNESLKRAAACVKRECEINPMFAGFGDNSFEYDLPDPSISCHADDEALTEAFASLLLAAALCAQDTPSVKLELSLKSLENDKAIRFSVHFPHRLDHELEVLGNIWLSDADPASLRESLMKDNAPSQVRAALLELACARLVFALGVAAETTPNFEATKPTAVFTIDFYPT